jgi:putative NIF3 family GTP cyclohydrolase 1 type 2
MITAQQLLERIQKNVGVPWQSQRPDGYSDGILQGSPDTEVKGVATTFTPTLEVLRRAVSSGKNAIICRESPFYSRGERAPLFYRNGPAPSKDVLEKDSVVRAKQDFISQNNIVILRLTENWDARPTDGQLQGLARALGWEKFHSPSNAYPQAYDPRNIYFQLPKTDLGTLARDSKRRMKINAVRVVGDPEAPVGKVALVHGLLLVAEVERILKEPRVDTVVAGDAVEWEAAPYFQDLVTAKRASGLILLGEEASEEPGSGEVAAWLKTFLSELPVEWIPAGEPFWTLSQVGS